jgi:hypothetical protein
MGQAPMTKKQTGDRWEITVDGKPRTYDHDSCVSACNFGSDAMLVHPWSTGG